MARLLPLLFLLVFACPTYADTTIFNSGPPDGRIAMTSQIAGGGFAGSETADDFLLTQSAQITTAKFYGLILNGDATNINQVITEMYHVFPIDSTVPPSGNVPTRTNSPSDVAFDSRDSSAAQLTYNVVTLGTFSAANSVINNLTVNSGGEGPVRGVEVEFDVTFTNAFDLSAGHYFFVPQVGLSSGNFVWLSASGPNFTGDLQAWIRNTALEPDWLRVGTDIVGNTRFDAAFELDGTIVPEPSTLLLIGTGLSGMLARLRKKA